MGGPGFSCILDVCALLSSAWPPVPPPPACLLPCSTSLHYVRCIKPNSQQAPGHFEPALVLHQLRCCGVLEVARIAAAGYPTRHRHAEFAEHYRVLLPELAGPGAAAVGWGGGGGLAVGDEGISAASVQPVF